MFLQISKCWILTSLNTLEKAGAEHPGDPFIKCLRTSDMRLLSSRNITWKCCNLKTVKFCNQQTKQPGNQEAINTKNQETSNQ